MGVALIQTAVVHSWRCTICDHRWETYGGDPDDFDPEEPVPGIECPNCDLKDSEPKRED